MSGSDLGKTGHFVWMTSGEPLVNNASDENQPDNMTVSGDAGHCVKMRRDGKRLKYNCYERMYFICENRDWQWGLENVIVDPK